MRTGDTLASRLDAVRMRGDVWTRIESKALAYVERHADDIEPLYDRLHAEKAAGSVTQETQDAVIGHIDAFLSSVHAEDIETDYGNEPTDEADVLSGLAADALGFVNDLLEGLHETPLAMQSRGMVGVLAAIGGPDERLAWYDTLYDISGEVLRSIPDNERRAISVRAHDLHGDSETYRSQRPDTGNDHVPYHNVAYRETRQKWAEAATGAFTVAARIVAAERGITPSDYGMRITLDATVGDPRTIVLHYMDHPSETSFGDPDEFGERPYHGGYESRERTIVINDAVDRCALPRRSAVRILDDQFSWLSLLEGRDAEIRAEGEDPANPPLWSYASPLILRLAMEQTGNARAEFMKNPRIGVAGKDEMSATQTGGIVTVRDAELTDRLHFTSRAGRYTVTVGHDRELPETMLQAMPGRPLSSIVRHPYLEDDRIVIRSVTQSDAALALDVDMPIVRLADAPTGIDQNPIRAWRHREDAIAR